MLFRNTSSNATVTGVGEGYFRVNGRTFAAGVGFNDDSISQRTQEAVIDGNARDAFFVNGEDPIGQVILLGKVPVRVIGVVEQCHRLRAGRQLAPMSTCPTRRRWTASWASRYLSSIAVRVATTPTWTEAEAEITDLLTRLHGGKTDFFLQNTAPSATRSNRRRRR